MKVPKYYNYTSSCVCFFYFFYYCLGILLKVHNLYGELLYYSTVTSEKL